MACRGFYEDMECTDYALPAEGIQNVRAHLESKLQHYRALHLEAIGMELNRWDEVPKHHYAHHIYMQAQYMNPRLSWCYPDQHAIRILK